MPFCFWITATVDLGEHVDYGDIKSKELLLPFQQHSFIERKGAQQQLPLLIKGDVFSHHFVSVQCASVNTNITPKTSHWFCRSLLLMI